jgi:hypothetical protein
MNTEENMKTLFSILSIAVVAILLAVPTVAQTDTFVYNPPGFYVNWVINLNSPNVTGASGIAEYYIATPSIQHKPSPGPKAAKVFARLSVECEYLTLPDLSPIYVFVGPGTSPNEPFGKLVGQMQVNGGAATWLSIRPPVVTKGTTLTVVRKGVAIAQGQF